MQEKVHNAETNLYHDGKRDEIVCDDSRELWHRRKVQQRHSCLQPHAGFDLRTVIDIVSLVLIRIGVVLEWATDSSSLSP
jgi:hypothetical protein